MALAAFVFTRDGEVRDFGGATVPAIVFKASGCEAHNVNVNPGRQDVLYTVDANQKKSSFSVTGGTTKLPYRFNKLVGATVRNAKSKAIYGVGLSIESCDISFSPDGVFAGDSFRDAQGRRVVELALIGGRTHQLGAREYDLPDPAGHFDAFQNEGGEVWAIVGHHFDLIEGARTNMSSSVQVEAKYAACSRGKIANCIIDGGVISIRVGTDVFGISPASVFVASNRFLGHYSQAYRFTPDLSILSNAATFLVDNDFTGSVISKV